MRRVRTLPNGMQSIPQVGSICSFGDKLSNFLHFGQTAWFKCTVKNEADIGWVHNLLLDVMFSILDRKDVQRG